MADLDVPYFLARPSSQIDAGIVVLQEGNGMTPQLLRVCERLAREGYAVVAPDLFFRTGGPFATEDFRDQLRPLEEDFDQAIADVAAVDSVLRALGARRTGVIGFCAGGCVAWHAARHGEGYSAAVGFYGKTIGSNLGPVRCPTLLFFGEEDPLIPNASEVAAYHSDTVIYPKIGHGFMRDGSEMYVEEVAADAWQKTLDHFRSHLQDD